MCDVIDLMGWRDRAGRSTRPRQKPTRETRGNPRGLVQIGEVSGELMRRLEEKMPGRGKRSV